MEQFGKTGCKVTACLIVIFTLTTDSLNTFKLFMKYTTYKT